MTKPTRALQKRKQIKAKKEFVIAMGKNMGNISASAKQRKISRQTFYRWYNEDDVFKTEIDNIAEESLDFAETMLKKNITEGKEASVFFFLKTKGKSRGYIETQEYKGSLKTQHDLPDISKLSKDEREILAKIYDKLAT